MNGWHSESNGFPSDGTFDPSAMLNNTSNPQFNPPQFQQARSQTPSQFPYTPQQLVPSKRPRDDSGAVNSPRPAPSNISLSRSQTPQQINNSFPGGGFPNGTQPGQSLPNNFQHLQHGSNNATPSPTLSNQQFRHQSQQPGMGISPPPDGSGRGTPQNSNPNQFNMNGQMGGAQMGMVGQIAGQMQSQNFNMPTTSMPQGYGQNFPGMQNMGVGGQGGQPGPGGTFPGVTLTANLAQQQAAVHRMTLQRQQQMMQQRQGMNPMMQQAAANQQTMGTPTRVQGTMANMQNPAARAAEERKFMDNVTAYMQSKQQPFDPHPMLAGRPINLYMLFHLIVRAGSSKRVTQNNLWSQFANNFGVPPQQYPNAGMELQQLFARNLGPWEAAYWTQKHASMQQMKQQGGQMANMSTMSQAQQTMSPNRGMPQGAQPNNQPQNAAYAAQIRAASMQGQQSPMPGQMTPQQNNAALPNANGWATPQTNSSGVGATSVADHRKSMSRQLDGSPALEKPNTFATPPTQVSKQLTSKQVNGDAAPATRSNYYEPYVIDPKTRRTKYGPVDFEGVKENLSVLASSLDIPGPLDVGMLDVQALTLSLQSGISTEVRYALDMLAKLTHDPLFVRTHYIELAYCGDLLEVLLDCGEDQVAFLSDESKRIEGLEHGSYEEIARLTKLELQDVQDVPEIGSKRYLKEKAAERLLSITTILRNLSFPRRPDGQHPQHPPHNPIILAHSRAVKFLSTTIELLASRVISLHSSINLQDFMKDVVVMLSNIAADIVLESQDDAYNFLQFLLAFAPGPIPTETNPFRFASYKPSVHKYYPYAIDVFAKLLARDDPNRTFFKQIFVDTADHEDAEDSDLPVHQQYDLLTRAFGMAIAAIPDVSGYERKPLNRMDEELTKIAQERNATLSQGMLTADILSMLIPASDPGLAKSWLCSQDSWGCVLFRVVSELAEHDGAREVMERNGTTRILPQYQMTEGYQKQVFVSIVSRAMSMLKRLAKKAVEDTSLPTRPPTKETSVEVKVNGISDHEAEDDVDHVAPLDQEALLDDLADLEKSPIADFLPLSDAIFHGIFANTKELTSSVIADYIALGEILH